MSLIDISKQIDPVYFLYIGVFLGVLLLFEGLRGILIGSSSTTAIQAKRLKTLRTQREQSASDLLLNATKNSGKLARVPLYNQVPARMLQAGMTMKPSMFLMLCLLVSAVLLIVVGILLGPAMGIATALLSGIVIPMNIINIMRSKRVNAFAAQLPDALDLMRRGLQVGHPLNVTFENVALSMSDPISTEFQKMAQQITYGETLTDAMNEMAHRIDQEDMHYLAASVAIQHGSGGNLAAMLGTLAGVVRQRFAMRRKIKAISSEGRISAWVLSSLPFIMYGGTSITAPGYYDSVSHSPLYMPIALVIAALIIGNFLAMRALVNFRI